ncbi:hypothetical protein PG996_002716 [Apiospora saccharicola]|uniref:Uncharacterized protein n=1 Tax=Apiospora saccharicola TaxID=335842 RepID=A0ABR1WK70_9PEZI
MSIGGTQMPDEMDHYRKDAMELVGKVLPRGGMAVSILVPLFFTEERPVYFWANLWPSLILVLLTVATWYPLPAPSCEFVLLRIPILLVVASIAAVVLDPIRARPVSAHEQPRLFPTSIGRPSTRAGSPLSSVGSVILARVGGGFTSPPLTEWLSDMSLTVDDIVTGDWETSIAGGSANSDLEADPGGSEHEL